ncbi:matrixin family metalloprotease [Sandaracinus amylolyticus]|uniref:RTX toxin n=1 Tax=Sandaracinus amylolyticus TaxID=927083 RepID=A0A0F6W3W9_9BACT|nr:matrixin family metalloprotease [Sandaracinus amylolyticus]AKF06837.1 RTX toxin [Sandaracinus amylolyticus]
MNRRALAALALVIALGADVASAWAPIDSRRPVWSGAAPYELHNAGSPDLGGFAMTESIVRQGMDDWTRVSCTSLTTEYRGSTTRRPTPGDRNSSIGWLESGWPYDSNAIGVTRPQFWTSITEADMEMNGVNYTWTTSPGSGNRVNAYSIVLHEAGHYYGLDHSSDSSAAMYYAYSGGTSSLRTDDQNGICALYPRSGTSDCTTTGCPSGQVCEGGTCVTMTGDGDVCSPCSSQADCTNGACLQYPGGAGAFCGRACTSSAQCGSDTCVNVGGSGQCVRLSGGQPSCTSTSTGCTSDSQCSSTQRCNTTTRMCEPRPTTGGPIGADCSAGTDCQSGLCFAGRCSQSCDWLNPASCPGGWYCSGEATGSCGGGGGVCVQGTAGTRAIGESCSAATECASLYCASGRCSTPCTPGGASGCTDGFSCQLGSVPGCGSCQRSGALGDPCEVEVDCTSRLCAVVDGDAFCTERCGEGAPCPTGFSCLAAGDTSVCVPDSGGLGSECDTNADCLGGICAVEDDDTYCTRICNLGAPCPDGFSCVATDDPSVSICRPPASGGCGCSAPGRGQGARGGLLAIGLLAALATWRARRRR